MVTQGNGTPRPSIYRRVVAVGLLLPVAVIAVVAYGLWFITAPLPVGPRVVAVDISPLTPVKNQGRTQLCWAYSMLAAIETEHFYQGDSVNLSIEPVADILPQESAMPPSRRAMGQTLLNLMRRHGIYSGVCDPSAFIPLCTMHSKPYGQWVVPDLPDNWEHNRFLNMHPDTLLELVVQAVEAHRGVCWEGDVSERGFSFRQGIAVTLLPSPMLRLKSVIHPPTDDHCMAIVGTAQSDDGTRYLIMKNSWGEGNPYGGLMLMTLDYLRWNTVAIYLPRDLVCPE